MKKYIIIYAVLLCLIFPCSCKNITDREITSSNNTADYISFTFSEYADPNNPDSEIYTRIFCCDLDTMQINEKYRFNYTTQYPLGVYDKKDDKVYFSKRTYWGKSHGDQIFEYDIKSGEEKQLTQNLFAVNYIIPTKNKIFFVAVMRGERVIKLGCYDKVSGNMQFWNDDNDTSIENITADFENEKIYISAYSQREKDYNIQHQEGYGNETGFIMPKFTLYQTDFDFSDTKSLLSMNKHIRMIFTYKNNPVAVYNDGFNDGKPSKATLYNIDNDSTTDFELPPERMQKGNSSFDSENKNLYMLSVIGDMGRGIYKYDFDSASYSPVYINDEGFINNFILMN